MRFTPRTATEISKIIENCIIVGDGMIAIDNVATIFDANSTSLTWLNPTRADKAHLLASTHAGCVIMSSDETEQPANGQSYLKCTNPKLSLVKVLRVLAPPVFKNTIHPTAVISPDANIHQSVSIGPYSVIESCEIGADTTIGSGVFIGHGTKIGRSVNIAAGVVIGADGFGYIEDVDGSRINTPHLGNVEIEDNVDIGANTCIDRGTLGCTRIKYGAKIDNLVHIAHNVEIGRCAMVIANTMIGGSTIVGDHAVLAPSATVRDAISVGSGAFVGLGALVTKPIPDGEIWAGHPAKLLRRVDVVASTLQDEKRPSPSQPN